MLKMMRGHLHFELGQLQGLIQAITAERNLSKEQEGLCREVVQRLGYLRQVVAEPGPDVLSDPTT